MSKVYGVYGASGFGKEVAPLVRAMDNQTEIVFIDDDSSNKGCLLNGYKVMDFDSFLKLDVKKKYMIVAIANNVAREKLFVKCFENDISIKDVLASNVVKLDQVSLGGGSILCPFVTLTSNIKVGIGFHANIYSYIGHDCTIGDFVTFAPSVKCSGNVVIEDHVYIGTGAIIHQGKPNRPLVIGKGAVVAAGAVVTKNVPSNQTVFGSPAIEFTKENVKRRY